MRGRAKIWSQGVPVGKSGQSFKGRSKFFDEAHDATSCKVDTMQSWFLVALLASPGASFQDEDPNYGLTTRQIGRMSLNQWMDHCAEKKGSSLAEYETRFILLTFADAVKGRIQELISAQPKIKQQELGALPRHTENYLLALNKLEMAISGGGTMYIMFHGFRVCEGMELIRDILQNRFKDPGPKKVSDGLRALDQLEKRTRKIKLDKEMGQQPKEAEESLINARSHYILLTKALANRSRQASNALIDFCVRQTKLTVLEDFKD